ncbi:MAG TPA: SDR family NAD(P)-dependent oxidoreductase [Ktedonobacteraceae bacterium]
MHDLKDKTAIVTGASRGIGTYIAQALAQEHMKLVLAARSVPELEEVAQRLRREGHQVLAVPTDVTDPAALEALVEAARREFGTVDVLVNNAGGETLDAYHRLGWEEVYNTLQVNLTAPMRLTHLVLPGMLAQGRGHIVNISSLAARNAVANQEPYCSSKAGLWGFTVALRASYRGSGVSASAICPGFIKGVGMFQRMQDATGVKTPFYGASPPEKVASAVVRAIKQNLPEVIVNPVPVRPFLALEALFPRLIERVISPINWNPPSAVSGDKK